MRLETYYSRNALEKEFIIGIYFILFYFILGLECTRKAITIEMHGKDLFLF